MTSTYAPTRAPRWFQRVHAALMPDYNRAATLYWWTGVTCGALLLLASLVVVAHLPAYGIVQVLIGLLQAVGAGLFPVRIPATKVSFAAGELCIFLVLLMQGPAAAVAVAAGEAAMGSYRTSKRWTSRLGSPAMATLAMTAAATLFALGRDGLERNGLDGPVPLMALSMVMGFVYFVFSATLMGGVARLRRGKHLLQLADEAAALRWVGLAYAGSALVSTLLYIVYRQAGEGVLLVTLPLLAMLLLVLHFYYRQQEAHEAMRRALAEVAEREAAMQARETEAAARHQRELQLSERRFDSAFTQATIGMALVDLDGRIIRCNEALSRLLGRGSDQLAGLLLAGLVHEDDAALLIAAIARAKGPDFEDFGLPVSLQVAAGPSRRVLLRGSFFGGPALHGLKRPGKPCLLMQVQPVAH